MQKILNGKLYNTDEMEEIHRVVVVDGLLEFVYYRYKKLFFSYHNDLINKKEVLEILKKEKMQDLLSDDVKKYKKYFSLKRG